MAARRRSTRSPLKTPSPEVARMRSPPMNVAAGQWIPTSVVLCRRGQPPRRTRQQLPAAVLFLPHLHDADFGVGDLAVELAFQTQRCRTTALFPTTWTDMSGHSSDLRVPFRVITPSMNSALFWSRASEWL